jgi:hypothetical protein
MPKEDYYRKMFFIGAVWNWLATVPLFFGYKMILPLYGMELPRYPVFLLLFSGLCFIFGIGYYWVSRDLSRNHDIVRLGIAGKLLVFVALSWASLTGQIHFLWISAGIVDLVFAVLFMQFLART